MEHKSIDWLLAGDPSIRWQVMRDLLNETPSIFEQERSQVALTGWGAELLARQDPDGKWARGVYSPKWTSTTYTLLLLRHLGLPSGHPQALRGCDWFYFRGFEKDGGINLFKSVNYSETCVNAMMLALLSYFKHPDQRIHKLAAFLIAEQMQDGGWNCRRIHGATHSSFHTTILVLEGLAEYNLAYPNTSLDTRPAVESAHEFLLQHRVYHSHHTGKVVDPAMTRMYFPPRWHYDFLRALDYFQSVGAPYDERLDPAVELLRRKQDANGFWAMNTPWKGEIFFPIETTGQYSRWNTLRALRVLKWCQTN